MRNAYFRTWTALILLNLMNFMQVVEAATIIPATSPLATGTTSVVRPNVMYVLDNSGSMNWDYLPDYVSDANSGGTGSSICWRGTSDTGTRSTCDSPSTASSTPVFTSANMTGSSVQIPLLTSDINYLAYNPDTQYQAPIKADGSNYPNSSVAAAYTDGFAAIGSMNFQNATTIISTNGTRVINTANITGLSTTSPLNGSEGLLGSFVTGTGIPANTYVIATPTTTSVTLSANATTSGTTTLTFKTGAYPHQVYCNTTGVTNPQNIRGSNICKETSDTTVSSNLFPSATYSNAHSYDGAPYYYTMSPMQYCIDSTYVNCQPTADATHAVPAKYRWCNAYVSASQTFSDCQDLRNATHTIPDYLGGILPSPIIAVQAYADLTINSYVAGKSITGLTVNGTNVIGVNTFTAGNGGLTSANLIAAAVCTAIQANTATSGYSCPNAPAANTLRIKANAPPAHASYTTPNGYAVVVTGPAVTTGTVASGTLALTSISGVTKVDDVAVGTTSLLTAAQKITLAAGFADGTNTTANAATLAGMITANSGTSGYSATSSGNTITVTSTALGVNTGALAMTGTGVKATGTITVGTTGQTAGTPASLGGIKVGTTTIVGALTNTNLPNGTATTTNATTIDNAVGASYTATTTGSVVTVTAPAVGSALNGTGFTFLAGTAVAPTPGSAATASTGTVTVRDSDSTANVGTNKKLNSLRCGASGTHMITQNTVTSGSPGTIDKVVGNSGSSGLEDLGANGYSFTCPNASGTPSQSVCTITGPAPGSSCTLSASLDSSPGYTVTGSMTAGVAAVPATLGVTNFAPALSGAAFSGGKYAQTATGSSLSGGTAPTGPIATNATSPSTLVMDFGVDPVSAGRVHTGKFTRVDIVPSTNSYPKASGRADCVGATCTYAEELQNYANWFSYYRSRLLMMKTTSTLAFDELDSKYRIGFDLLSHYGNNSIDLEVAQFLDSGGETANQRTNWWSKLTTTTTSGSTPLRSSLLKMGKYYAGKLTSAAAIPAIPAVKAIGTIQINNTTSNGGQISVITIQGISMLGSTFTVSGCSSPCSSAQRQTQAGNLLSQITSSPGYATSGYTATRSVSTITFTANTAGQSHNGDDIQVTKNSSINVAISDFAGGANVLPAVPAVVIEPLQYSCQQNFTLLVTDGYWNSDSHSDLTQLNGSTEIGNQDNVNTGLSARPYYDGAQTSTACSDSDVSSCGTLADIAMYYYKTDLRDSSLGNEVSGVTNLNVSANNVFKSTTDDNQNQHMVLFTMGLGAPGTLRYTSNYATATSGDYKDISTGAANWPAPKANDPTTIDDLWHAAVNGRGKYFSARDPKSVVTGLSQALASIDVREGAAAAAATSNLQPIAGDNFAYVANYTTNVWAGDLQARVIDTVTGVVAEPDNAAPNDCVSDAGCPWSAQKKLDAMDLAIRKVYMAPASGSALRDFTYANLNATEKTYFDPSAGILAYGTGPLSQYASVFAVHPTDITATKMVDFLRGDVSLEQGNILGNAEVWRNRASILGDIVDTQPVFVRAPRFKYQDVGYSTFVTDNADREGVVYVSGNDGMLHAFAADDFEDGTATGGTELWAFIPTATLPYLRYLADEDYVHRYFVDGQITVADVNFGAGDSDWHTILVGGLGGGGKTYYALDITDPVNPKYLWEFTHANLGLTFGNARIGKLPNGEWAVLFGSGYNNADGKGYLYAVNPKTGVLKTGYPITDGSGSGVSPSNLGKIAAWADNGQINNTITHIYAGDMEGDVWRFTLATQTAFKLAHLEDGSGNPQPITTRPELTLASGNRVIYVGTGRYLGDTDRSDISVQSFYALKDTLGAPNLGGAGQETWNPRTDTAEFLLRKLISVKSDGTTPITRKDASGNDVPSRRICTGAGSQVSVSTDKCTNETGGLMDWTESGGWYFDLPDSGERMNVDMNLTLGTLTIPSNVPASSACSVGGYGWLNFINFKTGLEVVGTTTVSKKIGNALIAGIVVIQTEDGGLKVIVTQTNADPETEQGEGGPADFEGKRDLWRELDPYPN